MSLGIQGQSHLLLPVSVGDGGLAAVRYQVVDYLCAKVLVRYLSMRGKGFFEEIDTGVQRSRKISTCDQPLGGHFATHELKDYQLAPEEGNQICYFNPGCLTILWQQSTASYSPPRKQSTNPINHCNRSAASRSNPVVDSQTPAMEDKMLNNRPQLPLVSNFQQTAWGQIRLIKKPTPQTPNQQNPKP